MRVACVKHPLAHALLTAALHSPQVLLRRMDDFDAVTSVTLSPGAAAPYGRFRCRYVRYTLPRCCCAGWTVSMPPTTPPSSARPTGRKTSTRHCFRASTSAFSLPPQTRYQLGGIRAHATAHMQPTPPPTCSLATTHVQPSHYPRGGLCETTWRPPSSRRVTHPPSCATSLALADGGLDPRALCRPRARPSSAVTPSSSARPTLTRSPPSPKASAVAISLTSVASPSDGGRRSCCAVVCVQATRVRRALACRCRCLRSQSTRRRSGVGRLCEWCARLRPAALLELVLYCSWEHWVVGAGDNNKHSL